MGGLGSKKKKKSTNAADTAGNACIIEAKGPPSSPSGFGNDRARGREGRSGELRPFPKSRSRETEGTGLTRPYTHPWEFGAGGDEDSFCQRRYLRWWDSAKGSLGGAREVLSSSAAEAAAARRGWISSVTPTQPSSAALPRAEGSRPPVTRPRRRRRAQGQAGRDQLPKCVGGVDTRKHRVRDKS